MEILLSAALVLAIFLGIAIVRRSSSKAGRPGPESRRSPTSHAPRLGGHPTTDDKLAALRGSKIAVRKPMNRSAYGILLKLEAAIRRVAPKSRWRVLPEVGMGAFLSTGGYGDLLPEDKQAFAAFNSKRVDFLVIDSMGHPLFAVEYHGSGHYIGADAPGRDIVKKETLRQAGIELVEVQAHMSDSAVDALLQDAVERNSRRSRPAAEGNAARTSWRERTPADGR